MNIQLDPYMQYLKMDLMERDLDATLMLEKYHLIIEKLRCILESHNQAEEIKIAEDKHLSPKKWMERILIAEEAEKISFEKKKKLNKNYKKN